jgi:hypothetical protein
MQNESQMFAFLLLAIHLVPADPAHYLESVTTELQKQWPHNRTVNIVFHGHSVPAGYFATPTVDTFNAYPHLTHVELKNRFPYAVMNAIVTGIGGENSVAGVKRFKHDVLAMNPDVVCIDYGLNDRGLPLDETKKAWTSMVRMAKAEHVKVLLFTPTPDLGAKMLDPSDLLSKQATQIREIASEQEVGLVDSYARFCEILASGQDLHPFMAQSNHPNRKGHDEVTKLILNWFPKGN